MSIGETLPATYPTSVDLAASGELAGRVRAAYELLHDCVLCGRQCRVDRVRSVKGAGCRTGALARVAGFRVARDLDPCLAGEGGAGVIEYAFCNLRCRTCATSETNQRGRGTEMEPEEIAAGMLDLQARGVDALVLRRPSHVIPQSLSALEIAIGRGLRLPVIYDSGGYDHPDGLRLLDGVVDIYVAETKSGNSGAARQLTRVRDYAARNRKALTEMHRQVGDLRLDPSGRARSGLLVRHRVLPNGLAHSGPVFRFLAESISRDTALRLVGGFEPVYQASDLPMLRRPLDDDELRRAESLADRYGLHRRLSVPT